MVLESLIHALGRILYLFIWRKQLMMALIADNRAKILTTGAEAGPFT
jgi:hypothetical protein